MKNFMRISALFIVLTLPIHESSAQRFGFDADSFSNAKQIAAALGIVAGIGFTVVQYYRAKKFMNSDEWRNIKINPAEIKLHRDTFKKTVPNPDTRLIEVDAFHGTAKNVIYKYYPWPLEVNHQFTTYKSKEYNIEGIERNYEEVQFGPVLGTIGSVPKAIGLCALLGFGATKMLRAPGK